MAIELMDPRTELVSNSAENVDHIFCEYCWSPGQPMMCGKPDEGGEVCPDDGCGHPPCSMCELEWEHHLDAFHSD